MSGRVPVRRRGPVSCAGTPSRAGIGPVFRRRAGVGIHCAARIRPGRSAFGGVRRTAGVTVLGSGRWGCGDHTADARGDGYRKELPCSLSYPFDCPSPSLLGALCAWRSSRKDSPIPGPRGKQPYSVVGSAGSRLTRPHPVAVTSEALLGCPPVMARPLSETRRSRLGAGARARRRRYRRMGEFLRAELAAGSGYLPPGADALRAFSFPFDAVRVLDRRPGSLSRHRGTLSGLSFSVAPEVRPLPRSRRISTVNLGADLGVTPHRATAISRRGPHRGVHAAQPGPHRPARDAPARTGARAGRRSPSAIRALVARERPLVAILWGRDAATLRPMLGGENCVAIQLAHLLLLSARYVL